MGIMSTAHLFPEMGFLAKSEGNRELLRKVDAPLHVLGLPPTRLGARAAFNPASVRLRMTLCSNSAFSSLPQNADMRRPRLCGVVNGIRAEWSTSAENQTDPLPGFDTNGPFAVSVKTPNKWDGAEPEPSTCFT